MICLKNKKILCFFVVFLNIAAFFTTVYVFINPAESQIAQNYIACGYDEHMHTDKCYASYGSDYSGKILNCEIKCEKRNISHMHDSFCYDESNKLICPLEEYVHIHDQSCFNENNEQICGIIIHQHSEQCFRNSADIENPEDYKLLVCSQNVHVHRESCFEMHTSETEIQSEETSEDNSALSLMYSEIDNEDFEVYSEENIAETYNLDTGNAIDISEKSDGEYTYIDSITVSYQLTDNSWIQVEGSESLLPADADYRFEVTYKDISIQNLSTHDGKIKLEGIPNWLNPDKGNEILFNSVPIASMQVEDGTLLITFYNDFINDHMTDSLSGSFFVRGDVKWQELNNNAGEIHLPTIDMTIHFEDDLPQKYGQMSVSKSDPEFVYNNEKPYLKYVLTVRSLESNHTIPDVKIQDSFTHNSHFVKKYFGIPSTAANLSNSENGFDPYETSTVGGAAGTVTENADSQGMCWNIGDLQPNEERTLTYYAELDEYYIGSFGRGSIINTADAFSGDTPKGSDSSEFIPRAEAWINKKYISSQVDDYGTGTITYEIDVTAPSYNNYDLVNLRLHDYVDSRFNGFVEYPQTVTAASNMDNETIDITTEKPDNTSFNAEIPVLRPGETITVTYTVELKNILALETGNIDFLNTAELFSENNSNRGEASNWHFGSSQNNHTFSQSQWVRKLDGGNLTEDIVVSVDSGEAYQYGDSGISTASRPDSFAVPKGSKKYQIVLNERGVWDLSSAVMKDKFQNTGITYTGWLCIQEFEDSGVTRPLTETEVLSTIGKQIPSKTVWLNIDGRNEFDFKPSDLGLSKKYTYLMTYYAGIEDVANTGEVMITNDFEVYGTIGVGGTNIMIGGIKVGVSSIMQGNVHYNLHKDAWYYSEYPDEDGTVPIANINDYSNGVIYWVIRLDGTINAEFRVKDIAQQNDGKQNKVRSDAVAGIYKGSKSLDFINEFNSYSEMLEHVGSGKELEQLNGNNKRFNRNSDYIGMGYDETSITDISQLDGKKFVIANLHPNHPAIVTNTIEGTGLFGNKNISYLSSDGNNAVMGSDTLAEWTFQRIVGEKYYIYSYVDGQRKYMSISGTFKNGNVSLTDTPTELYVNLNNGYAGKIRIANEHGMALNWYGANGVDKIFGGWTNGKIDVNDYQTLFELKDDYKWCAGYDTDNIGICFLKNMNLAEDEALYIVVRTMPSHKPSGSQSNDRYKNGVASKQNNSSSSGWVHANTTEYILKTAPAVYKEGKTSYIYDGVNWVYLAGEKNTEGHNRDYYWKKDLITEPGIYAEWLINVNWDGSMKGLAEVCDKLPDYATPVYLRQYYTLTSPTYPEIPELIVDNNWEPKNTYDIPFYYNSTTNEIRWRVDNLVKETNPLAVNSKTVNLQLICKISDPDILFSGVTKDVDNTVTVKNKGIVSKSVGTVPVAPKYSLQKSFAGNLRENNNGEQYTSDKKLPFEIIVNPCSENIGDNYTLPPLIDEFTDNLKIIESSIEVKSETGEAITDFTYKIEYKPGNNKLIINKLPNGQKIIITYEARTTAVVDKNNDVIVSNKAYWSGYEPPEAPQVDSLVINYSMGGDVTLTSNPSVLIFKVDGENSLKRLSGAEFELYEQEGDSLVETGTTGNDGKLFFGKDKVILHYDKVYYIKEKTAPEGYKLSDEKHYFVILKDKTITDFNNIPENTDMWDSSILDAEYECTITNSKETISVNKTFINEENESFTPDSGKFIFGIFDKNPENYPQIKPLQILEIEYINGEPQYKLDGVSCDTNEFTVAEPNQIYYVFELDEFQNPISNETYMNANRQTYKVRYSSQLSDKNMVTVALNKINIENQTIYFSMPETGGIGLKKYYLFAALISIIFLLTAARFYYLRRKSL